MTTSTSAQAAPRPPRTGPRAGRADGDIQRDVEEAMALLPRLGGGLRVSVHGGVVRLAGHVATFAEKAAAAKQVWSVPGVLALLLDELIVDSRLEDDITHALGRDPLTSGIPLMVQSRLGEVTLSGNAPSPATRRRAVELARDVQGVVSAGFWATGRKAA